MKIPKTEKDTQEALKMASRLFNTYGKPMCICVDTSDNLRVVRLDTSIRFKILEIIK